MNMECEKVQTLANFNFQPQISPTVSRRDWIGHAKKCYPTISAEQ